MALVFFIFNIAFSSVSAQKNAQKISSDTPGRFMRSYSIAFYLLILEEGVAATIALEAGETAGHGITCRGSSIVVGRLGSGRGCILPFSGVLAATAEAILDVFQNDHGHTALLLGLLIFPDVLVVAADQGNKGTFLELHLADAFAERSKGLHAHIDPSVILVGTGIIDLRTDTETNEVPFLGELDGRLVVKPLGYDDLGCDNFEHN